MVYDETKFLFFLVQSAPEARSFFANARVHLYTALVKKLHFASSITLIQEIIRNFNMISKKVTRARRKLHAIQ